MDIIVKTKNCDVASRVKQEAVEKVGHATRFFDRLTSVEMVMRAEQNPRIAEPAVVEVTARVKGHHIRAEGCGEDHRAAVDVAVGRFERQLARYKSRLVDKRRGRAAVRAQPTDDGLLGVTAPGTPDTADAQPQIVRTKRFVFPPMLPDDAALQLELLGHDFYVFTNAGTGECNVVYRRRDGDLGLIVPGGEESPGGEEGGTGRAEGGAERV